MTARELELLQRAEAAELAVIEAVRQRDMLREALDEVMAELDGRPEEHATMRRDTGGMAYARTALAMVQP